MTDRLVLDSMLMKKQIEVGASPHLIAETKEMLEEFENTSTRTYEELVSFTMQLIDEQVTTQEAIDRMKNFVGYIS